MAVMEQEEINYKSKQEKTQLGSKSKKQNEEKRTIKIFSDLDKESKNEIKSKKSEIIKEKIIEKKEEFEKVFEIDRMSETVELIENFNLEKVSTFVDSAIKNPDTTIIVMINPKKTLMEMLEFYKTKTEYDFKSTKLFKVWDIIVELSKNIRDRESECKAFDIILNSPLKIIDRIKIFFTGKNLEYLFDIVSPITPENNEKFLLPIIERCMKFSSNAEQLDIYNCINQLKEAIGTNKIIFPEYEEDINGNKYSFYTKNAKIPVSNFYRIVMFNGVITEKINENDFDNLLIKFKKNFKIVFNYFNYEYDYQLEKKVYNIFDRNDLFDFKFEDYHFFLKSEENLEFKLIKNYKDKVSTYETLISSYFITFNIIKNTLFKNEEFIKFAKMYELEHTKLNNDYNIIKKNYNKVIENKKKNNLSSTELNHIKTNFQEMLNKKIIRSHLNDVKGNIDFKRLQFLMENIHSEINSKSKKLIEELDKEEDNITNMSNYYNFYLKLDYIC